MNIIYLIRGLPGSGKSTLAKTLTRNAFETDRYFMVGNTYAFDASKLKLAHEWNQDTVEKYMRLDIAPLAVANTFSQLWELKPYLDLALKYIYHPVIIEVQTQLSDTELAARTIHSVPADSITKMRLRWESIRQEEDKQNART